MIARGQPTGRDRRGSIPSQSLSIAVGEVPKASCITITGTMVPSCVRIGVVPPCTNITTIEPPSAIRDSVGPFPYHGPNIPCSEVGESLCVSTCELVWALRLQDATVLVAMGTYLDMFVDGSVQLIIAENLILMLRIRIEQ